MLNLGSQNDGVALNNQNLMLSLSYTKTMHRISSAAQGSDDMDDRDSLGGHCIIKNTQHKLYYREKGCVFGGRAWPYVGGPWPTRSYSWLTLAILQGFRLPSSVDHGAFGQETSTLQLNCV